MVGGWLGGWVGGLSVNKANLSPARAGTGLRLAKIRKNKGDPTTLHPKFDFSSNKTTLACNR